MVVSIRWYWYAIVLDSVPATTENVAGLREAVRASIGRGCLRSLEKLVQPSFSVASRHPLNVEKLHEQLLGVTPLPLDEDGRFVVFLNLQRSRKAVQQLSLQQRERKKLLADLAEDPSTPTGRNALWRVVLALYQRNTAFPSFLGIEGGYPAHYCEDFCRFRHAIGLADAVHMAMFNLGITVGFPSPRYVRLSGTGEFQRRRFRGRLRFKGGAPYVLLNRFETVERRRKLLCHYLSCLPARLPEKSYIKIIKESMVDAFCVSAEQERPRISIIRIPLFPEKTQERLDRLFSSNRKGRIRFYKNIMESKSLCAEVGDDMIREAYENHRKSLCRDLSSQTPVPEAMLRELFEYGVKVGRWVQGRYDPYTTRLPNSRATVEKNRASGGARRALESQREAVTGPLFLRHLDGATRMEPFVIGLFGDPGCGKTTAIQRIVGALHRCLFPDVDRERLVYSRSCSTEHWDGYRGQPIVVLDDLGHNLSDRTDIVEFEQLVSVNRYVLPMAALEEKGRTFTSPVILTTSNLQFCSPLRGANRDDCVIEDDRAFWRRFHLPVYVYPVDNRTRYSEMEYISPDTATRHAARRVEDVLMNPQRLAVGGLPSFYRNYRVDSGSENSVPIRFVRTFEECADLNNRILDAFRVHSDYHVNELSPVWRQDLACLHLNVRQSPTYPFFDVNVERRKFARDASDITVSQCFPKCPPFHPPVVEAVAIPEPLKVRMITKAEADTKCLQPFQRVLFDYLKSQPQFALTHGVSWSNEEEFSDKLKWIERIELQIQGILARSQKGDLWLSGDYASATDEFPLSVTNALVEGILSEISHEPTRQWVRYEVSPHRIRYPGGIVDTQTSGQLMGSLISFPLLCFLNDFIISRSGFAPGSYLINGDDVVARGSSESIRTWREDAPKVGLSLSIGKNFIDPQFCCVNSQLFWEGHVQHTGKVSCSTRYGKTLSRCYCEMQYYYGDGEEIRREFTRRNIHPLRNTPRSLHVPVDLGGLALSFSPDPDWDRQLAKKVYIVDFLRPFSKSFSVPGYPDLRALEVPVGFFTEDELELGGGESTENREAELFRSLDTNPIDSDSRELSNAEFRKEAEKIEKDQETRHPYFQVLNRDFRLFPPLGMLRTKTVYVLKGKVGYVKQRIRSLALRSLVRWIDHREADPETEFHELSWESEESEEGLDPLFSDSFPMSFDHVEPTEYLELLHLPIRVEHLGRGLDPVPLFNDIQQLLLDSLSEDRAHDPPGLVSSSPGGLSTVPEEDSSTL
nr:MAG: putative RNA-dependent RNA polymerase [Narnaviridae sp.]